MFVWWIFVLLVLWWSKRKKRSSLGLWEAVWHCLFSVFSISLFISISFLITHFLICFSCSLIMSDASESSGMTRQMCCLCSTLIRILVLKISFGQRHSHSKIMWSCHCIRARNRHDLIVFMGFCSLWNRWFEFHQTISNFNLSLGSDTLFAIKPTPH